LAIGQITILDYKDKLIRVISKIGNTAQEGFNKQDLEQIQNKMGGKIHLLNDLLPDDLRDQSEYAGLLIIPNGVEKLMEKQNKKV